MKRFAILPIMGAALLAASGAQAQETDIVTHDVKLTASVAAVCSVDTPTSDSSSLVVNSADASTFTVAINEDSAVDAQTATLVFGDFECTSGIIRFTLNSQNKGLTGPSDSAEGFTNVIAYNADLKVSGESILKLESTDPQEADFRRTPSPSGQLQLDINIAANSTPLVAGTYEDTLELKIVAQL